MAVSAALMRMLLVLCALVAPALALLGSGSRGGGTCVSGLLPEGKSCKDVTCCGKLTCGFTSTGGGFYCL